ncbi:MAG: Hint domain-containing protein [Acetobacteraceae bacterium]
MQQYNTTDTYLWSIMSYIEADETSAKYYSYYSVTGTSYTPQLSSTTPQMLDIIGLQQLYGLPASTTFAGGQVFGFNTNITDAAGIFYDFTRNVDPVVTLWDSGVGNTLDLSGFFTPSVVNLNPGTFSSVDGMTNNIAIAYGTAIDHAIGGAGADTFILNASSDVIDGGGGSNTATFRDASAAYVISATIGGYNVSNGAVTHRLSNIQTLAFPDAAIAVAALPAGDTFQWRTGNGAFGDAANWTNLTTGGPAATPPDADDVALLPGPVSGGPQIVSGDGKAAQLVFTGLAGVTGALTTTRLTIGQGGGQSAMLTIAPDATITSDSAAVGNGTLRVNGRLTAAGTVTMSPIDAASSAVIEMRLGGVAQVGALVLNGGTVTVDASSAFEVGTAGGAAAGKITIDADGTISGNGALSSVVDEGTVIAAGGTLGIGSLTGSKGVVRIAADGTLRLADSTAVPIAFSGAGGTLALKAPVSSLLTLGSVSGFAPGAAIAITALEEGKALSLLQPVYDAGTGLLSVRTAEGAGVAAKLVGDFGDDVFVLRPTGTGTFTLLAAPGTLNGSTTPSAGTQDGSVFAWATNGSGDWNTAANWKDLGTTPQSVAPGAKDNTVVQGAILPNTVQVLSGTANALNLLFLGTNAVSGQITVGETLAVGMIGDPATLSLIGSATIAAATVSVPAGTLLDVAGGTRLAITNDLTLASDPLQSLAPLQVHGGGIVQAGSLVLSGSAAPIALDRISTIEVGTGGDAAAGMLTVDAGHAVRGSGDLSTIAVADNGTVLADGGVLSLGMVSGSGSLRIGGNATLSLAGAEANPIDFAGANGTLLVRSTEATLGMVTGFNLGETIAVAALPQSLPTTVNYTPTGTQLGTLSLTNQFGTKVTMTLVGDYSGVDFVLGSGATPSVATVTVTCFVAGTRIATPDGEVAIESLRPGDLVCTRFAPEPQPVVWIGRRHLDCRQHPAPHRVWPVRVRAGCFGPGMPARDPPAVARPFRVRRRRPHSRALPGRWRGDRAGGGGRGGIFPPGTAAPRRAARRGNAGGELPGHRRPRQLLQWRRGAGLPRLRQPHLGGGGMCAPGGDRPAGGGRPPAGAAPCLAAEAPAPACRMTGAAWRSTGAA